MNPRAEQGGLSRSALFALILLVPAASFGTWMAMIQAPGPFGQTVFSISKLWILLFPLIWTKFVDGERLTIPKPSMRGMPMAVATGLGMVVVIGGAYLLFGRTWIDAVAMREVVSEAGLSSKGVYIAAAIYWCTINSLLEEYVWRWFVFVKLEQLLPRFAAVIVSGLFFTLHHIIALSTYFDVTLTTLGSIGVFCGGATWSWIYLRYRNIYAAYISHLFADVVIFVAGYQLLFG